MVVYAFKLSTLEAEIWGSLSFRLSLQSEFPVALATYWGIALSCWIENPLLLCLSTGLGCSVPQLDLSWGPGLKLWVCAETSPCSVLLQLFATHSSSQYVLIFTQGPFPVLNFLWRRACPPCVVVVTGGGSNWWCYSLCWPALAFRASTTASESPLSLGTFLATIHERGFAGRCRILAWEKKNG